MSTLRRDVVVVGASAGGVQALRALVAGLPADLPASVLVVLHLPPNGASALPAILSRAGVLPAKTATHGVVPQYGHVYVAPSDCHLSLNRAGMVLSTEPARNGHRPAIDVLFQSAAETAGSRVVGVVLSGSLYDGTEGLNAVRECGGLTIVQHRQDASYPEMPESALRMMTPDDVLPVAEIGPAIARYVHTVPEDAARSASAVRSDGDWRERALSTAFNCPRCGTQLVDLTQRPALVCRAGHRWDSQTLLAAKGVSLDEALRRAIRVLEDRVSLARRLESAARSRGQIVLQQRYGQKLKDAARSLQVLRGHVDEEASQPG
jgi:two-component system chemotaxis response regulator CheB